MTRLRLQNIWINVRSSLWFLPTVFVIAGVVLAFGLTAVDARLAQQGAVAIPLQVAGTVDAARSLLSVIAGSLITVVSIAFSITIVAIQQVAVQFSPRVLRTFTGDRGYQIVLGTYLATSVYALLVLRAVRSADEGTGTAFVPTLAVACVLLLSIICLGLLIYFIHHISQSLQVAYIMNRVRHDFIQEIDKVYPLSSGDVGEQPSCGAIAQTLPRSEPPCLIRSRHAGFIRRVNEQALLRMLPPSVEWALVQPQVGAFVPHGGVLIELNRHDACERELQRLLPEIFILDSSRTITQDPLYGIRQLVDIALKALSPAINDMTTAEYVLVHLGDALGRLAQRSFPPTEVVAANGHTRCIFNRPSWDEFVDTAFSQIRRQAVDDVHVTSTILRVLYDIALRVPPGPREDAVAFQVAEILRAIEGQAFSPNDKALLLGQAAAVEEALQSNILLDA